MQFLAPSLLFGGLAVSIPIALHFFYRARYKPLPWAPMKFLKEAIEQTSRRLKFQEWILLALRCLALLLLAIALARPSFTTATTAARGQAIDAVFVFDTSYSMGANEGEGKTRLERAKDAATAVLETLPAHSSIQIYGCADRAYLLGPVARFNLDQARQVIQSIELTSLATDFLPGLTEAFNAVKKGGAAAKEIYVFTDLQQSGFKKQEGAIKAKCEEIKPQANLVFVRCAKTERHLANVRILDVSVKSDIPHTKSRVPFVVTLENKGTQAVQGLHVGIELDGKAVEKDEVQVNLIEAGQTFPVTVTGSLDESGVRLLTVTLRGDDLPGDNVLYKTIFVRDKVRVLLVDGTPSPDSPLESGDHFVKNVLNPDRQREYFIEVDSIPANEVGPQHLENKDIVYLLNAPIRDADPLVGMSSEFLARLNEFVRSGGGLMISAGDKVNIAQYNKVLGKSGSQLLPFEIADIRNTTEESPFSPAPESVAENSFVDEFRKPPFSDALRFVTLNKMLVLNKDSSTSRVLVRTTDGEPLLVSKVVGAGEVIMITTSLDESWGKFPSDGRVFVPFTRYEIQYLTNRKVPGGTVTAGNPLNWLTPDQSNVFELVQPAKPGERVRPRVKLEVPESQPGQSRTVSASDTLRAGIYNIVPAGKADDAGPLFAINPDLTESDDLAVASNGDVESWCGYKVPIIEAGASLSSAVDQVRSRSEWTVWILFLLLFLLVGETVWAWVCGRAW